MVTAAEAKKLLDEHTPKYSFDISHAPGWFQDVRPDAEAISQLSEEVDLDKVTLRHFFGLGLLILLIAVFLVTAIRLTLVVMRL